MTNVRIQDDLYQFVNGEWLETAVIPDDKPTTGGFSVLADDVEKIMMTDFNDFALGNKTTNIECMDKAIKLYKKVLDTKTRNEFGIKPLLPILHKIQEVKSIEDFNKKACELSMLNVTMPFECGVTTDMQDATKNSFVIVGPSIILPDTTYYGTPVAEQLIGIYTNMAQQILAKTDLSEAEQKQYLEDTIAYDKLIAQKVKSQVEWADYVKVYNPTPIDEVCESVKPIDFKNILTQVYGDSVPQTIIVFDPRAIKEMNGYFNEENFNLYLHWSYVKTLISGCSYLSEELSSLSTVFTRALMGIAAEPTLEKKAYQIAGGTFSQPVGIYYGLTYFGEEAKKDVISLVKKIIEGYKQRMADNNFLEESTKEKAIKKLSAITIKMGYPDFIEDIYKKFEVKDEDSLFDAMLKISKIKTLDNLSELYKPTDKKKWRMPGHMVNACYDPNRNDITFPAAILQKPFYSLKQTVSENLGGIGAVIAHEISHAFDNNGAHFDENGCLFNWWTEKDSEAFKELTQKMIKQWDGLEFSSGTVNGELVVSENIADNGGVAVTLQIMHETENANFQEYFINWAKIWCQKAKPEYEALLLKSDVHSPTPLRANIQVRNFQEWYDAFDVKETDKMYIKPEDRIIIW